MHTKKTPTVTPNRDGAKKKVVASSSKTKSDGSKQVIRKKLNEFDDNNFFLN